MTSDIKENLIAYIFQTISLDKYKYILIKDTTDLDYICKNNPYYGYNYYGFNHFLVFLKLNNTRYSFFIDRKTLKYDKKKIKDYNSVITTKARLTIDHSLYNGTILDGILNTQNGKKTFIITDAFYVGGESYLDIEYKTKMEKLKTNLLSKIETNGENDDNIKFLIDDVYNDIEFKKKNDLKTNTLKPSLGVNARGIICYPTKSGVKYIQNFNKKKVVDTLPKIKIDEDELNKTDEKKI